MLYLAADKHGFTVLQFVQEYLDSKGLSYENLGVKTSEEDMKLEDMIPSVTRKVLENETSKGILICGTGVGVEVGANKFSGIRACLATNPQIAEYASVYDKCNVICLVGWDDDKEKVHNILDAWLNSHYDGSEDRLRMFEEFNRWH